MQTEDYEQFLNSTLKQIPGIFNPSYFASKELNLNELFTYNLDIAYKIIEESKKEIKLFTGKDYSKEIHFGYIDNSKLNAFASTYDNFDFIGINSGAIIIIYDLFHRMLSNPNTFKNIGDSSLENEDTECEPLYNDFIELLKGRWLNQEIYIVHKAPLDPDRNALSFYLADLAVQYLIEHEMAHILYGHIYLNKKLTGNNFMMELNNGNECQGLIPLTKQALEWHADVRAFKHVFLRTLRNYNDGIREPEKYAPNILKSQFQCASYTTIAIYIVLRLFWGRSSNLHVLDRVCYPPAEIRQVALTAQVGQSIKDFGEPALIESAEKIIDYAMYESEKAIATIIGSNLYLERIIEAQSETGINHFQKIILHWDENIKPMLEQYSLTHLGQIKK